LPANTGACVLGRPARWISMKPSKNSDDMRMGPWLTGMWCCGSPLPSSSCASVPRSAAVVGVVVLAAGFRVGAGAAGGCRLPADAPHCWCAGAG
jgi:hypothetical protein